MRHLFPAADPYLCPILTADVAKLVDAPDLGSGAVRRGGSIPFIRTKFS